MPDELVKLHEEPRLRNPYLVAAWPGIGNIGLISVNYLKENLEATEFGEIVPYSFFFPHHVSVQQGVLTEMEFPASKLYYKKGEQDLIIFLGEMQPRGEEEIYRLANCVLDVGQRFGVQRVYTAGAAVAPIHHTAPSRVWAVPNTRRLLDELKQGRGLLMSQVEREGGQGNITGLNGLLLGVARKRRIEGICFLGEVPGYMAGFPLPYPRASRSILEVLAESLGVAVHLAGIDPFIQRMDEEIEKLYRALPEEVREQLERLRTAHRDEAPDTGAITETDKEKILKDIEEFFGRGKDKQT